MDQSPKRGLAGTLIAGIILVLFGVAFLLDNFDLIYLGPISHYWPLILVAIGIGKLLQAETSWERRRGAWWILIGLWLLVSVLHMFGLYFHNSWPLLLIIWGIFAIWKAVAPTPECRLSKG